MNHSIARWSMACAALLVAAVVLAGCFGIPFSLPPFVIEITIADETSIGPSEGIPPNITVRDLPFRVGDICNLPDLGAIEQYVEEAIGPALFSLVRIEKVEFDRMTLRAERGNFNTLTELSVIAATGGVTDRTPITLGTAEAPGGFGKTVVIVGEEPVDLLGVLRGPDGGPAPDCASATIVFSGKTPANDIVFSADLRLVITVGITL